MSVEPAPINTELPNAYSMTIVAPGRAVNGDDRTYVIYNMNDQVFYNFKRGSHRRIRCEVFSIHVTSSALHLNEGIAT